MFCTRVAWVCLVCLLLCKEEGSSPVSLQLLRGGIWACMRYLCLLHSLYKCRLVRRTPYACSPAVDGSVLIVTVHRGLRFSICSSSMLRVGAPSVLCCCLGAEYRIYCVCCADTGGFPSCLRRVYEEQLSDV